MCRGCHRVGDAPLFDVIVDVHSGVLLGLDDAVTRSTGDSPPQHTALRVVPGLGLEAEEEVKYAAGLL
ncbi:hypothetical protein ACFVY0_42695 [Streptomyces sp. NPDC058286]|uniref:hypothetical protein n=1 Tax=Streptomyces sp. NPDC058286 TaxID=3346422 RepID=UPI0036E12600